MSPYLCHVVIAHHLIQDWHEWDESSLLILTIFIVQKSGKKNPAESRILKRLLDSLTNFSLVIPIIQRFQSFLHLKKEGKKIHVQLKILTNNEIHLFSLNWRLSFINFPA